MAQSQGEIAKFRWPRWFDRSLKALLTLIIASNLGFLAESFALDLRLLPAAAWTKASWSTDPAIPNGWFKVDEVDPDGQLGRAGVVRGDLLKPDKPFYHMSVRFAGDRVGLTIEHNGQRTHSSFVALPLESDPNANAARWIYLLEDLKSLVLTGFVLLLLFRRWREKAAMSLALLLLGYSIPGGTLPHWAESPLVGWSVLALQMIGIGLVVFALPFCHYLVKPQLTPADARIVKIWAMICVPATLVIGLSEALIWRIPGIGMPLLLFPVLFAVQVAMAISILVRNFRAADPAGRNRIKMVAAAFVLSAFGYAFSTLSQFLFDATSAMIIPMIGLASLFITSGPLLLVYTVLRHKLFDFSFDKLMAVSLQPSC